MYHDITMGLGYTRPPLMRHTMTCGRIFVCLGLGSTSDTSVVALLGKRVFEETGLWGKEGKKKESYLGFCWTSFTVSLALLVDCTAIHAKYDWSCLSSLVEVSVFGRAFVSFLLGLYLFTVFFLFRCYWEEGSFFQAFLFSSVCFCGWVHFTSSYVLVGHKLGQSSWLLLGVLSVLHPPRPPLVRIQLSSSVILLVSLRLALYFAPAVLAKGGKTLATQGTTY